MQHYYYYSKIPSPRPLNCMSSLLYSFNSWPSCAKIAQIICRIDSAKSTAPLKHKGGRAILRTSLLAAVAAAIMWSTTDCVICLCPWQCHALRMALKFEHQRIFFVSILAKIELIEDIRVYSSSKRCLGGNSGKIIAKSRNTAPPFSGIFIWSPKQKNGWPSTAWSTAQTLPVKGFIFPGWTVRWTLSNFPTWWDKTVGGMFVICVNFSSSCRAANAGVLIINDSLPLNRLRLNKAPAIILSSCLTDSFEGIGGKVEDCFFLFEGILDVRQSFFFLLQLGGFSLQLGVLVFFVYKKKRTY